MKILQVLLALSALIVIHELGHFTFAKIFGIRVDKFFLFFDVGGSALFSTKKTRWFVRMFPKMKDIDTEYGIGWLPLGGYCKIAGMVDESMDTESLAHDPEPWEMRSKPAWQRLFVMAGGVLFNLIFAVIAYTSIMCVWGESYISNECSEIYASELAVDMGFRTGDRILALDDYVPENFGMLQADIARRSVKKVTVLRDGDTVGIYIDRSRIGEIINTPSMFDLAVPFVVDTIPPYSPNADAGLARGDRIIEIAGTPVRYVQDSRALFASCSGGCVDAKILRSGDTLGVELRVDTTGHAVIVSQLNGIKSRTYGFMEAIPAGLKMTFSTIGGYLDDLKMVATPSTGAYKSVGSFISIGRVFPAAWDWYVFVNMLALLSIMLGVVNLLPIPALDGGHIVFIIYEMITGRKPGERFLMAAQMLGMVILMFIMVIAFGNDISSLFR